jgi:hypothetical protein
MAHKQEARVAHSIRDGVPQRNLDLEMYGRSAKAVVFRAVRLRRLRYRVDIPAGRRDNLEPRRRAHRCMSKGQGPPTERDQ